ncbi:MAG: hypothetical protein ACE5E7_03985 [Anaerolineae bacterium]
MGERGMCPAAAVFERGRLPVNCEKCRIGRCHQSLVPYITRINEQLLVIPNTPAYTCDICGHLAYDVVFINQIYLLLDHLTDDTAERESIRKQHPLIEPPGWQSTRRSQ